MNINKSAYILLLAILMSLNSCDLFTSNNALPPTIEIDNSKYYYYEKEGQILKKGFQLNDGDIEASKYYVVSKDNSGSANLNKQLEPETKTIKMALNIDQKLSNFNNFYESGTIDEDLVNHILDKLNFGYQVEFTETMIFNSDDIKTEGKINQNNVYADLQKLDRNAFFDNYDWHVYLFDRSDFFNTANAVCLKDGEKNFIMGDGNLLQSPFLFIHEMGHALGLTHSNLIYRPDIIQNPDNTHPDSTFFNVMHESNIGCSRYLSHRQFLTTHAKEYIEPVIGQDSSIYQSICGCYRSAMDDNYERYINSFDRNIDDTPIVGDAGELINRYREELEDKKLDDTIQAHLINNFEREWVQFLNNFDTTNLPKSKYTKIRLANHKKLRRNNLVRWLRENRKLQGASDSELLNFFGQDSIFYITQLDSLSKYCCYDLSNELAKIRHLLSKLYEKIDLPKGENGEIADSTWINCFTNILPPSERDGASFDQSQNASRPPLTDEEIKIKLRNLLLKELQ